MGAESGELRAGELKRILLATGEKVYIEITPSRGMDVGAGKGRRWTGTVEGGAAGVIFDGRGRPLELPGEAAERRRRLGEWIEAVGAMPGGPQ